MAQLSYCDWFSWTQAIGSSNREARGPWHLINLRPLYRSANFAIENSLQFSKVPPFLTFSSFLCQWHRPLVKSLTILVYHYIKVLHQVRSVTQPGHLITGKDGRTLRPYCGSIAQWNLSVCCDTIGTTHCGLTKLVLLLCSSLTMIIRCGLNWEVTTTL